MILPFRIGEARRIAGECDCLQRRPDRIEQLGSGFDHDDLATGPSDVESKLIGVLAQAVASRLRPRQPQGGRAPLKCRPPAGCSRQVEYDNLLSLRKQISAFNGGVAAKIDSAEAGAAIEREGPDVGDAVGDDDARQAQTSVKPAKLVEKMWKFNSLKRSEKRGRIEDRLEEFLAGSSAEV